MTASFTELGLSQELLKAVEDLGFEEPSPIQVLAIPALLTGKDAVGQAQTGTGKTAAFGLPILESAEAAEAIAAGDTVSIDFGTGVITDETTGETFQALPFPEFIQNIIDNDGLLNSLKARGI